MLTAFGSKEFIRLGPELAPPKTPWYIEASKEVYNRPDPEKARRALWPRLERASFKVDLQVLDWAALVKRRSNPELWDVLVTHGVVFEHPTIRSPLSAAWPGWWDWERKERLGRVGPGRAAAAGKGTSAARLGGSPLDLGWAIRRAPGHPQRDRRLPELAPVVFLGPRLRLTTKPSVATVPSIAGPGNPAENRPRS